ncbi:SDR family NAD(P)-dependent oxidoreductase [Flagellimonas sp. DF-77]
MFENYFSNNIHRHTSKWVVLVIDSTLISLSFFLSYLIRFNLTMKFNTDMLWIQLPMVVILTLIAFLVTGSYKGVVRHTGVKDVYNIFNAICLSSILLICFVIANRTFGLIPNFTIPLSIIIIHSLIGFLALTAARYIFKTLYTNFIRRYNTSKNVLIYGAGESGVLTYNAISSHSGNKIRVLGYIDDDLQKIGKSINGTKVFGKEILNKDFLVQKEISEVIFATSDVETSKLRKLVENLVDLTVEVKIVPPVEKWINGELNVAQIKQVQIEDLLNRVPIRVKSSKVGEQLKGQSIMVTGGAGSIGSEIVRQIANYDYKSLIVIDQAESALYDLQQELKQNGFHNFVPIVSDIRDKNRMNAYFQEFKPTMVFHAAAYKHVPLMECNAYEATKTNVIGTKILSDLALQHGVDKFVFVSTDKAVNPTNVMGATKRIAEMYISCLNQENKTKFITTRFGNVLGSNGSVIPLFKKQIEKGGAVDGHPPRDYPILHDHPGSFPVGS